MGRDLKGSSLAWSITRYRLRRATTT